MFAPTTSHVFHDLSGFLRFLKVVGHMFLPHQNYVTFVDSAFYACKQSVKNA